MGPLINWVTDGVISPRNQWSYGRSYLKLIKAHLLGVEQDTQRKLDGLKESTSQLPRHNYVCKHREAPSKSLAVENGSL